MPATNSQDQVQRHGAYICVRAPERNRGSVTAAPVPQLAARFRLQNEFDAVSGHPGEAFAFLRRAGATPGTIADDDLLAADAIIHVASPSEGPVLEFCAETARLLAADAKVAIRRGVVRPTKYTGNAMQKFAYADQVVQQSGKLMPNAFLLPTSKTLEWWSKDWMERHTYFLPRYDDAGRMRNQGHVLAAAPGIASLMRRTYKNLSEPASEGEYDFLNYFECADGDIPTFHAVCAALRNTANNPEWKFVCEGPTWHGRRVQSWPELFD